MNESPPPAERRWVLFERWWNRFAYVFNRFALGAGTLSGFGFLYLGYYGRALLMFTMIPVYFKLKDYFDAP